MSHRSLIVKLAAVCLILCALVAAAAFSTAAEGKAVCPKPRHRSLVLISARTGRVDRSFPDASGPPLAMVTDGRGGWFVAVPFDCVGKVWVNGIAHLRPDGRLDRSWRGRVPRTPIQGAVTELVRVGNTLFAASGAWVEALDARTGNRHWQVTNRKGGWGGGLAANRSFVFIGGYGGTRFKGVSHPAPVALAARTGKVNPWRAVLPQKLVNVGALALDRENLFLTASSANGFTQATMAVDARTGRLTGWRAPKTYQSGRSIFITHGLVLSADQPILSETTGQPVAALRRISGTTFAAAANTLYVAGDCRSGSSFAGEQRDNIGAVNLTTSKVTSWAPRFRGSDVCFQSIAADPKRVLVAK